jgi:hypothetical protein
VTPPAKKAAKKLSLPKKSKQPSAKKRPSKSNKGAQNQKIDEDHSSICPGCEDAGGAEAWVKCNACEVWWHEACSSYEGHGGFICDFC